MTLGAKDGSSRECFKAKCCWSPQVWVLQGGQVAASASCLQWWLRFQDRCLLADAELVLSWVHPSSLAETDMGIQEKGLVTCPIGCVGAGCPLRLFALT